MEPTKELYLKAADIFSKQGKAISFFHRPSRPLYSPSSIEELQPDDCICVETAFIYALGFTLYDFFREPDDSPYITDSVLEATKPLRTTLGTHRLWYWNSDTPKEEIISKIREVAETLPSAA